MGDSAGDGGDGDDGGGSDKGRRRGKGSSPRELGKGKAGARGDGDARGKADRGKRSRRGGGYDDDEATMRTARPRKKKGGRKAPVVVAEPTGPVQIRLTDSITVGELAEKLGVGVAAVVKDLMKTGVLASITQASRRPIVCTRMW